MPVAALAVYPLVAVVVLSPLLLVGSIRRLCRGWPTRSWVANYALGTATLVVAQVGTVVAVVWTGLAVGLPATGRWDPTADGWDGRLVLAAGAVWYLVASTVAVAVLAFLLFPFNYPG